MQKYRDLYWNALSTRFAMRPEWPKSSSDYPENPDEFYQIAVFDNISNPNLEIRPRLTLLECIQQYISSPIIESSGELRREAWGIAEMKVCAALLGGSTNFAEGGEHLKVISDNVDGAPRFVYQLQMMKPKQLCAVTASKLSLELRSQMKEAGIRFFNNLSTLQEFLDSNQSSVSFRFFLLDCRQIDLFDCDQLLNLVHRLPSQYRTKNDAA